MVRFRLPICLVYYFSQKSSTENQDWFTSRGTTRQAKLKMEHLLLDSVGQTLRLLIMVGRIFIHRRTWIAGNDGNDNSRRLSMAVYTYAAGNSAVFHAHRSWSVNSISSANQQLVWLLTWLLLLEEEPPPYSFAQSEGSHFSQKAVSGSLKRKFSGEDHNRVAPIKSVGKFDTPVTAKHTSPKGLEYAIDEPSTSVLSSTLNDVVWTCEAARRDAQLFPRNIG